MEAAIRRPRILLVDDDAAIRQALADFLTSEGFVVEVANDGKSALDRLLGNDLPTLVIVDLMMPIMDGWEFTTVLRSYHRTSRLPMIAISAGDKPAPEGVPLIAKPIDTDRLMILIRERSGPHVIPTD